MNKTPDTILYNGKIYTVDSKRSIASAVAIAGDSILAVGSDSKILPMAQKDTKKIDLGGKLVLPGLNDSHGHFFWMATQIDFVAFTNATCIQDCLDLLADKAKHTPAGEWIITSMTWHETQLREKRLPTRKEIDSVCPNNPVCIPRGGHVKVCNSKAMEIIGIDDNIVDPPGGKFGRDENGLLDGMMIEAAAAMVDPFLPISNAENLYTSLKKVGRMLNSFGVTTTAEMGVLTPVHQVQEDDFHTLEKLHQRQELPLRVSAMMYANDYEMARWGADFGKTLTNTEYFKFQGIKLLTDGGVEGANLIDPYMVIDGVQPNADFHGVAFWPQSRHEEFRKIMQLCADRNLMLQAHVYGDKAAGEIIPLLIEQAEKTDVGKLNWTICHLAFATPQQLDMIKKHDICVTVQHQPFLLGLNIRRFWGDERANKQENYRAMIDKGLRMGGGTDYPIGPANPFPCIQFMVDRKIIDGSVMGKDNAITLEEAVYLWTQGSADCEGWGDMIGSVEAGKKADLAVLNQDIFSVPVEEIHNTTISSTWVGGQCIYHE